MPISVTPTASPDPVDLDVGVVTLSAEASGGEGDYSYLWEVDGVPVSGEAEFECDVTEAGPHIAVVYAYDENGEVGVGVVAFDGTVPDAGAEGAPDFSLMGWGTPQTLTTDAGPARYWVLFPEGLGEEFAADASLTTAHFIVPFDESEAFVETALGYAVFTPGQPTLRRVLPMACPWSRFQFLASLTAVGWGMANAEVDVDVEEPVLDEDGEPVLDEVGDPTFETVARTLPATRKHEAHPDHGWPVVDWVKYKAVFGPLPFDYRLAEDAVAVSQGDELCRFVERRPRPKFKERAVPGPGYVYDDGSAGGQPLLETKLFFPFHTVELVYVWHLPKAAVPWAAIKKCGNKTNPVVFDGLYEVGCVLFHGLAGEAREYVSPTGDWWVALPYLFEYQRADGVANSAYPGLLTSIVDGWNKVPANDGETWKLIRQRGSTEALPTRPYKRAAAADWKALFKPGP